MRQKAQIILTCVVISSLTLVLSLAASVQSQSATEIARTESAQPTTAEPPTQNTTQAAPRLSGPAKPLQSQSMTITVGRGQLIQLESETSRVSVSDPVIADAVVISPNEVVLNGKSIGRTTIMIWHGEFVSFYEVTVEPDLSEIQRQLGGTFPGEQIDVKSSKDAIILSGVVSDPEVVKQAAAIAGIHAKSVVNCFNRRRSTSRRSCWR